MLTELGVRGGPSLSLSLARAETFLMIDGHLHWGGPVAVGSLSWPLGGSWFGFPCARDVGLLLGFVCLPRAMGFLLGCFVGCACMWVLGFVFHV